MKTRIIISVLLILSVLVFIFAKPKANENNLNKGTNNFPTDSFYVGVYDNGYEGNYSRLKDTLHLGLWHKYWSWSGIPGMTGVNDGLYADSSEYYQPVLNKIDSNHNHNLKTVYDRIKIWYLANGQRSDYQAEPLTQGTDDYWFYSYYYHGDFAEYYTDNDGTSGMHCVPGITFEDGYIFSGLKSNREQINRAAYDEARDDSTGWHILPRIRIKPEDTITNKNVCRIDMINSIGVLIDSVKILTDNFKDIQHPYYGQYLDTFYFENSVNLLFINDGYVFNPDPPLQVYDTTCAVDFKVWWYGDVEMWIDRIRVEDNKAHKLLYNPTDSIFSNWLRWETGIAKDDPERIFRFYVDEFEFNSLPCIKYINNYIDSVTNGQLSLMVNLNYDMFDMHLPDPVNSSFSANEINKYLIQNIGTRELLYGEYPLEGYCSTGGGGYIPNTLPINNNCDVNNGILGTVVSPDIYENWLQEHFDSDYPGARYIKAMKRANDIIKLAGSDFPFIPYIQAHSFRYGNNKLREPTDEEILLMTNLAISYGAKGIMYFTYAGYGEFTSESFCRGLSNPDLTPRYYNAYGQPKWNDFRKIADKINVLGPYLISFNSDYTNSYVYRRDRDTLISNTYFKEIKTSIGNIQPICNLFETENGFDPPEYTYIQAATFKKENENFNKYFMLVNRRCSPVDSSRCDGRREVFITLDSTDAPSGYDFQGFNNWEIKDVYNDSLICVFDKRISNTLSLGWYMPGEGKLYKIAPVMQEGGTLMCDESVTAGSFVCDSIVFNDGHNITLYPGTEISFNAKGKIVMNGGSFITGSYAQSSPPRVILKGNSCLWEGLSFENCDNISIGTTDFANILYDVGSAEYQNTAINIINCFNFAVSGCSFNLSTASSAINISINEECSSEWGNAYFGYNNFTFSSNNQCPIYVYSLADCVTPIFISNNTLINNEQTIDMAMMLDGVIGGTIRNNVIKNFNNPITILNSTVDLLNNYIYTNVENNNGIHAASESNIFMTSALEYHTGGGIV